MSIQFTNSFIEEFWKRVEKTDSCWLWTGGTTKAGYGQFRTIYAHRTSWELNNGPIPVGMEVCHDCPGGDNPACVNPDHLFLGTHAENLQDMRDKKRHARGETHGFARLTDSLVTAIRTRFFAGEKQQSLADLFDVKVMAISNIVNRKTWKHLPLIAGEGPVKRGVHHLGANNANSVMTPDTVRELRALREAGLSLNALARKFQIAKRTVHHIVHRRTWAHVE